MENDNLRAVCEYLTLKKHFFFRVNTTPIYDTKRQAFRAMPKYAMKGVPDIILIWNGNFIGLEVKQKGTYQSKDQKIFEQLSKQAGAEYYVVRNSDDLVVIGL